MLAISNAVVARRASVALLAMLVVVAEPAPGRADGEFAQLDVSASTTGGVASVQRGPLTYGGVVTIPDGDPSATLSATQALNLPVTWAPTLRVGPALGLSGEDLADVEAGLRLSAERYTGTDWGSVYGLVDLGTIDRSWFVLGQVGLAESRLTFEFSHGASDEYEETTMAVSRRLRDSPVSLRAGYQVGAGEVFLGVSLNTF
jgi:hypothetical protein